LFPAAPIIGCTSTALVWSIARMSIHACALVVGQVFWATFAAVAAGVG
jgi:hypothetical protein